ncbi:MAG: 3-demethylubiquinone-9 3-O-methyltransferase [Planctomycetes bacterium]|nr:3-demethylubiquinone-9 3-O-methyltransferase [Planctomycetota bacterium]
MTRPATSSIDNAQYGKAGWWDADCRTWASLRSVTLFRLQMLRTWLGAVLPGAQVVDLGCGGGLLAIPLAETGARVLGLDQSRAALDQAIAETARRGLTNCLFQQADMQDTGRADGCADVVLLADVLEHLPRPERAIAEAARLLHPGGHLFVNTINRTWRSRFLAITVGEGCGFIPKGTHDWRWFLRPDEVDAMAEVARLRRLAQCGERPAIAATLQARAVVLRPTRSLAVGWCALYRKENP